MLPTGPMAVDVRRLEHKAISYKDHANRRVKTMFHDFSSLKKIKTLPKDTEIFFGHEYTLQNSNFCIAYDTNNKQLQNKISEIKENLKNGLPTVPTILDDEIQCNIFLKAKDLQTFSKLRDLKDNF